MLMVAAQVLDYGLSKVGPKYSKGKNVMKGNILILGPRNLVRKSNLVFFAQKKYFKLLLPF